MKPWRENTLASNIRETVQENTLKRIVEENLHLILSFLVKLGVLIIIQLRRPALIFNIATYLNKICSFYCSSCSKCPTWSTCCLAFCGNYCAWERKWALKKAGILAELLHRLVFAVHTGFFWKLDWRLFDSATTFKNQKRSPVQIRYSPVQFFRLLSGLSTDHTGIRIKPWE